MAFLLEIVRLGLKNLRLHKLRSFLTSLGIILGVGAVIVMVSIGEGTKRAALREIEALGATNIIIRSVRPPESGSASQETSMVASFGLTRADLRRVQGFLTDAAHVVPVKSIGDEMTRGGRRAVSQAFGTTPELVQVTNLRVARGRYITDEDMRERSAVCVIGDQVAKQFFSLEDPIGKDLDVGRRIFRVVGVLRPVGLAGGAGSALVGRDLNKDVHVPLSTAELDFGDVVRRRVSGAFTGEQVEVYEIFVTATTSDEVMLTAERVRRIIEVDHRELRDVEVIVPWELLDNVKRTQLVWNVVLITIAAISLLIGGIGIMNIMLASVTERTREIGIRRALGATRRHVVAQFLVETGTLASAGGLIGIGIGIATSIGIGKLIPWILGLAALRDVIKTKVQIETHITGWSIVVSFLVAAVVGIVFGIYPALVASRQDPIVALRHD